MRKIIAALGFATILSGTAFVQQGGLGRSSAQQPVALGAHMEQAADIAAEVNQAYGTSFPETEVAPPAKAGMPGVDVLPGSGGSKPNLQTSDPDTQR